MKAVAETDWWSLFDRMGQEIACTFILLLRSDICRLDSSLMTSMHTQIADRLLRSGNCLGVLAAGLCESLTAAAVVSQLLSRNSTIAPLIVILNSEDTTTSFSTSRTITGETATDAREAIYAAGGVVIVTQRVLLSDLLCRRLDAALINLLLLQRAHEIGETSNEAFIVRVFRERNATGLFIGLSDKPHAISRNIEAFVKMFYLTDIVVIPRFHEIVQSCLSAGMPDLSITQHDLALTVRQVELGSLITSIVSASVEEILKNKFVNFQINSEELIKNKNEIYALRNKLEPVWMKLSWTARQIISDLAVIRKLLVALERYHSVHFQALLQAQQQLSFKTSPWWLGTDAMRLVKVSADRVGLDRKILTPADLFDEAGELRIEIPPKWKLIDGLVDSLFVDVTDDGMNPTKKVKIFRDVKLLIVASDDVTGKQLEQFAAEGSERTLLESLKRIQVDAAMTNRPVDVNSNIIQEAIDSIPIKGLSDIRPTGRCQIQVSCNLENPDELMSQLLSFLPDVVVLMEPSLSAIRCVEVYRFSLFPSCPDLAVHVLSSDQSVVEPSIPTLVDRENQSFDALIRGKNQSSFHSKDELFQATKQMSSDSTSGSSRQGGSRRTVAQLLKQTVLVDTRELRSALPFMLYKKSLDVVPTTLGIGDYIISRDIAIERKSVTGSDLQQSLMSGRLYKQLVNMSHAFAWPVLLLEFSTGKSFQLQTTDSITGEINPSSLMAQIVSLMIHFPSVRLIWSPSFAFTASVIARLKVGREQPRLDPSTREPVSAIDPATMTNSTTTKRAIEFLKACPGVTAANLGLILKRVKSVRELVELSDKDLVATMGKRDGHLFLKFINHKF